MKINHIAILFGALLLASCQKGQDPDLLGVENQVSPVETIPVFHGSFAEGAPTKTQLIESGSGSFSHLWYGDELVAISNGTSWSSYSASIDDEPAAEADLVACDEEEELEPADLYFAWSPSDLVWYEGAEGETLYRDDGTLFLPSVQQMFLEFPDEFCNNAPLVAVSETTDFAFANLCGYISLNLKDVSGLSGAGIPTEVMSVTLHADKALSGTFRLDASAKTSVALAESLTAVSESGDVSLEIVPNAPSDQEDKTYAVLKDNEYTSFLLSLPPGAYDTFTITVNGRQGVMRKEFSRTFTAKKSVLVERAKITDINLTVKFPTKAYLPDGVLFSSGKEYSWGSVAGGGMNAELNIKKIVFESGSSISSGKILWQSRGSLVSDRYVYANFDNETGTATVSTSADAIYIQNGYGLFQNLHNLESVEGLENVNTEEATDLSYMFANCLALTTIDLTPFQVGNVTTCSMMFSDCSALQAVNLSTWETQNLAHTVQMFGGCRNITSLNLGPKFSLPSDKRGMCASLGEDQQKCTITCSSEAKAALLETDSAYPAYSTTRLGNEGKVSFDWIIVE